jgi:hypothetical protein
VLHALHTDATKELLTSNTSYTQMQHSESSLVASGMKLLRPMTLEHKERVHKERERGRGRGREGGREGGRERSSSARKRERRSRIRSSLYNSLKHAHSLRICNSVMVQAV